MRPSLHDAPFTMQAYYADDVKPPKRPGGLAIETWHRTESSLWLEVQAARSVPSYGRVVWSGPVSERIRKLLEGE